MDSISGMMPSSSVLSSASGSDHFQAYGALAPGLPVGPSLAPSVDVAAVACAVSLCGTQSDAASGVTAEPGPPPLLNLKQECKAWKNPEQLEAVEKRIERLTGAKARSIAIAKAGKDLGVNRKWVEQQLQCAGYVEVKHYPEHNGRPAQSSFMTMCCQRWKSCPICAHRRSIKALQVYVPKIMALRFDNPRLRAYFVTLTIPTGPDLAEQWEAVQRGLKAIQQRRKDARRGKGASVFGRIEGALMQFEVKRSTGTKEWHVHLHGVWLVEGRIDYGQVRREWSDIAGAGQDRQMNIQMMYADRQRLDRFGLPVDREAYEAALFKDLCEVVKYSTALGLEEVTPADVWEISEKTIAKRFLRSFGCLRGGEQIVEQADLDIEPDDPDLARPYVKLYYHWIRDKYKLFSKNRRGTWSEFDDYATVNQAESERVIPPERSENGTGSVQVDEEQRPGDGSGTGRAFDLVAGRGEPSATVAEFRDRGGPGPIPEPDRGRSRPGEETASRGSPGRGRLADF